MKNVAGFSHGHKHGAEEGSLGSWTAKLQDLLKGSTFQRLSTPSLNLSLPSNQRENGPSKDPPVSLGGIARPVLCCASSCILASTHGLYLNLVSRVRQTLAQSQPQLPAGYVMQQV